MKSIVHVDGKPCGVFGTIEEAQENAARFTVTGHDVRIETLDAPYPTLWFTFSHELKMWVRS